MNIKETMIKNLLVNLFGNGTKDLNIKGSISFDLVASFKEDGDGSVNVTVNRNDDDITIDSSRELDGDLDVPRNRDAKEVPVQRKSNGPGWDSI